MAGLEVVPVVLLVVATVFGALALLFFLLAHRRPLELQRLAHNPILAPDPTHWWESEAVFNPAAIVDQGRVHIFYRAMGSDGVSRIGYASSADGLHFDERLPYPVYASPGYLIEESRAAMLRRGLSLSYETVSYGSGGGWGGSEDPKISVLNGRLYMTYVNNNGWEDLRVVLTSLSLEDFRAHRWNWSPPQFMSKRKERDGINNKSGIILEELVGGKHVIFHRIWPNISIDFREELAFGPGNYLEEHAIIPARHDSWDSHKISMGSAPIKTPQGWLAIYHAADKNDWRYKIGAMLLDLTDPSVVRYRSASPILEPQLPYENEWKAGIVYPSGAVVLGDDLLVYYGGGDKYVAAAKANLNDFLRRLQSGDHAVVEPVGV